SGPTRARRSWLHHSLEPPDLILRCCARRDIARDGLVDRRLGSGAVTREAAVGPFDAAIAERHAGLGEHDEAAFETAQPRDLIQPGARTVVNLLRDAHDDM